MTFRGLYVPLLTPMTGGGALALDALGGHIERLLGSGVDGFVALGTTGEFADLTADERVEVTRRAIEVVDGRAPVLVGVGGVGTAESRQHAEQAADAGADALLSLPPLYWKLGEDGLVAHFRAVAAATALPLVLYDFPALAGTALTATLVERVAVEIPSIVGIKLSGPELRLVHAVLERVRPHRPDFSVLLGSADLVLPGMLAGASGTIAAIANVDPAPLRRLLDAVEAGDTSAAVDAHRDVLRLLAVPALTQPPILALKAAAATFGSPLEPVVRTTPANAADVAARLREVLDRLEAPSV